MTRDGVGSLAGVVIAFDIDNTLIDSTGETYRRTQELFWRSLEISGPPDDYIRRYEEFRSLGDALERLGLANPIHERAHPEALAAFVLLAEIDFDAKPQARLSATDREGALQLLREVDAGCRGVADAPNSSDALAKELALRRQITKHSSRERFVACVREGACEPRFSEWSRRYQEVEAAQPVEDHRDLLERLADRGATCAVISEGRESIQRTKLVRSGLAGYFEGRVLLSERAAHPPGRSELDDRLAFLLDRETETAMHTPSKELSLLWNCCWIVDAWSRKSPGFFARCLHALHQCEYGAEKALDELAFDTPDEWAARPMRFIMVGDRTDKDAAPLSSLLGEGVALRLILRCGKYRGGPQLGGSAGLRCVSDWPEMDELLLHRLAPQSIRPIDRPPSFRDGRSIDSTIREWGRRSPISLVRRLAECP